MERFKAIEKEMKTKAFSKEGLMQMARMDPKEKEITVLKRRSKSYVVHARATVGGAVRSAILPGLEVEVRAVFSAAKA